MIRALLFIATTISIGVIFPSEVKAEVILSSQDENVKLYGQLLSQTEILYDSVGKVAFEDVLQLPFNARTADLVFDPYKYEAVWLKIVLSTEEHNAQSYILYNLDQNVGSLTFYEKINGKWESQKAGKDIPFYKRKIHNKNVGFSLKQNAGETRTYYLKYEGDAFFRMWPRAVTVATFIKAQHREYIFLAFFYGILLIMLVYNVLLYFTTRNRTNLYYALYVLFTALFTTNGDGLLFGVFWPNTTWINTLIFYVARPMHILFFSAYLISFLKLKKRLLQITTLITVGYVLFTLLELFITHSHVYFYIFPVPYLWGAVAAYIKRKEGYVPAKYLFWGSSILAIGIVIGTLHYTGIVHTNFFGYYFMNMTIVVELILFSYALANSYAYSRKQKEKAQKEVIIQLEEKEQLKDKVNRELEQRVKERTQELEEKYLEIDTQKEQLEQQAHQIMKMNEELDKLNYALQKDLKSERLARSKGKELSLEDFKLIYPDEFSCKKFLRELKEEKGFECSKCQNKKYKLNLQQHNRRCTKCGYVESVTKHTVFEGFRIPLDQLFYASYLVFKYRKDISSTELSNRTGIAQKTCWNVQHKLLEKAETFKWREWDQIIFVTKVS